MIDTHCHLDAAEFDADRDAVIARAGVAGVETLIVPAIEKGNWQAVRELAEHRSRDDDAGPQILFALGIHPLRVEQAQDEDLDALRDAVSHARSSPRFVGIGEIGLDHFVEGLDRERQLRFFVTQLRIARDFDLPVILHVRRAVDTVARELRRLRPVGGIAHAFNGSEQQASAMIELDMALGFGGASTFTRARNLRRLAASLPIESLVLETDSPDIPPAWLAPGRNEPEALAGIASEIAKLRGIEVQHLTRQTSANARRVLGIPAGAETGARP